MMAMPTQLESLITNAPQITQTQATPTQTGVAVSRRRGHRLRSVGGIFIRGQYSDVLMKDAAKPTYTSTPQAMSSNPKVFTGQASASCHCRGAVMTKKGSRCRRARWS
jgi:hypothetical protein